MSNWTRCLACPCLLNACTQQQLQLHLGSAQMRFREGKCPGQGHTARTLLIWETTEASLHPDARLLLTPTPKVGASHVHV